MGATILIIDDEESIRFTFAAFLQKQGHRILTAKDPDEAMAVLSGTLPDLIFVDIVLGASSGLAILGKVRHAGWTCPVVMITGQPDIDTAAEALRLGAFDYLPKPVRKETLLRVTRQALDHKALVDETNRIRKENEHNRNLLEAILASVTDAIVTVDGHTTILQTNASVHTVCGISSGELIGKPFEQTFSHGCNTACLALIRQTLASGETCRHEHLECRRHGLAGQVIAATSSPLRDAGGRLIGAVLVLRDITRLRQLEDQLEAGHRYHQIVGKSDAMQAVYRLVENLAETDTTVLITGESGTGKELVAKALHQASSRKDKPMVSVNCAALPDTLLESELFGHVRGAFTGAVNDRKGRFELARGGTLFLDEIGDISPPTQAKLLRVLQEKVFERVGDPRPIACDARIIAATNADLRLNVTRGQFRQDLYYRLKVVEVNLPPLRDRREDIPLLVGHFCRLLRKRFGKPVGDPTEQVIRLFMDYPWPGNVRELAHAIEHAFVVCPAGPIGPPHLPPEIRQWGQDPALDSPDQPAPSGEDRLIQALRQAGGNKAKAARLLGLSRQTLYRQMTRFGIQG